MTSGPTVKCDFTSCKPDISSYIAIWLWLGWFFLYPVFFIFVVYHTCYGGFYSSIILYICLLLITISGLFGTERNSQPQFGNDLGKWIMINATKYFQLRVVIMDEEKLNRAKLCFFGLEPHDILPIGIFSLSKYIGAFGNRSIIGSMTSIVFKIPLIKHIYTWVDAVPAEKNVLTKHLQNGDSCMLCPGGVKEVALIAHAKPNEVVLYLQERHGFIKLCLTNGAAIVPYICFGQRNCFSYWMPTSSWFVSFGRKAGFLPMMYFGLWGLPLGPPKPCQITAVCGVPIEVPGIIENPTNEQIKHYKDLFIEGTRALYDANKALYGDPNTKLIIK